MQELSNIRVIRELMERHGVTFSKALGQNFLINPTVCPRMAESSGADSAHGVLEIGPGVGVLTVQLCQRAKKVVAIELDTRLLPVLRETLGDFTNVEIVHGDAMKLDLRELLAEKFPGLPVVVCANLPYYITSPILMRLLEQELPVEAITVMVQKEAAQRICAPLGSRETGALTVAVQYYSIPRILFSVSRGSFLPAPEVDSAVVRLDVRPAPPVDAPRELFFRVVRAAFSMRRKTMLNCLSGSLPLEKRRAGELLLRAGVPENARAENLGLEEFASIARALLEPI